MTGAATIAGQGPRTAIIVSTYDHAHFLADALDSIASQTRQPDEVIVVNDGSNDNPGDVTARYPFVRLVTTANQGLAASRNTGAMLATADLIVFLDADDVLLPIAIEAGLACMAANPGAGFVYGAYHLVDEHLKPTSGAIFNRLGTNAYRSLLKGNLCGMHATVMYDRARLLEAGSFDATLRRCEDYDMFLRMARHHRVASHTAVVADYRLHSTNMTGDADDMLDWVLRVHLRHKPSEQAVDDMRAWRQGLRTIHEYNLNVTWRERTGVRPRLKWQQRMRAIRNAPGATPGVLLRKAARKLLPAPIMDRVKRIAGRMTSPPPGKIDMGDLERIMPISQNFGFARGTPVDRIYIAQFLARHTADIHGHVLEVGDASYCHQYGKGITRQDVLHVSDDNPDATIIGDLSQPGLLEPATFDCMVLTQVLHLIYDMPAAVAEMKRALKPGGVLLLTVPGISPVDLGEWGASWFWSLTGHSARRLFEDAFGAGNVEITVHGNAFAATCFIQGIAAEEINQSWLDPHDPAYPVTVTVRAVRPHDHG